MAVLIDRWEAEPDKRNGKRWCVRYRDDQNKSRRKTLGFWDRVAKGLEKIFSSAFPKK